MIEESYDSQRQSYGIAHLQDCESGGFLSHDDPVNLAEDIRHTDIVIKGHDGKGRAAKTDNTDKYGLDPFPGPIRGLRPVVIDDKIHFTNIVDGDRRIHLRDLFNHIQRALHVTFISVQMNRFNAQGAALVCYGGIIAVDRRHIL